MSVKDIKERHEADLRKIKGVIGVGYNGSIIVYVEKATPQTVSFIPKNIEGQNVKIIETGSIKLLSFPVVSAIYGSRVDRVRPPVGGISISHQLGTAGTLESAVKDKSTGKNLGLSCNHVIGMQWGEMSEGKQGDAVLQPGVYDGGTNEDKIGELQKWVRVENDKNNSIDAAVFEDGSIGDIIDVGKPSNAIDAMVGMKVKKSGRSSGLTFGKIIDVNASVDVDGWGTAPFVDQIVVSPAFALPGDSGSWVGDENDRTVGMVFAGSTEVTVVNKAKNIEELLGIEFASVLPYIPLWKAIAPIPIIGIVGTTFAKLSKGGRR